MNACLPWAALYQYRRLWWDQPVKLARTRGLACERLWYGLLLDLRRGLPPKRYGRFGELIANSELFEALHLRPSWPGAAGGMTGPLYLYNSKQRRGRALTSLWPAGPCSVCPPGRAWQIFAKTRPSARDTSLQTANPGQQTVGCRG